MSSEEEDDINCKTCGSRTREALGPEISPESEIGFMLTPPRTESSPAAKEPRFGGSLFLVVLTLLDMSFHRPKSIPLILFIHFWSSYLAVRYMFFFTEHRQGKKRRRKKGRGGFCDTQIEKKEGS
jgi:hypothetical protein